MNRIIYYFHSNAFLFLSNKMCTFEIIFFFGMDFAVNFYAQGYHANDTLYLEFQFGKNILYNN